MLNGYISDLITLRDNINEKDVFNKIKNYNKFYKTSKNKYISQLTFKKNCNKINILYNNKMYVYEYNYFTYKPIKKQPKKFFKFLKLSSFIISLFLLCFIFFTPTQNSFNKIYKNNYEIYEGFVDRGENKRENKDELMGKAFINYENKEYDIALKNFNKILKIDKYNIVSKFYSGIINLELNNFTSSINFFKYIIEHDDNYFLEQSEWYLSLCYLKMNDKKNAIKYFNDIVNSDSFYKDKAKKILNII